MQYLAKIRARTKLIKYIFLSASLCLLVSILVTLYIQKLPTEDELDSEFSTKKSHKLSNEYSLNINKSVFEGIGDDLAPYIIMAQNVVKNSADKYLLDIVNGTYTLPDGKITIKAGAGTLNELEKSILLHENVTILFNGMIFNSKEVTVDLDTKDAKSDSEVEISFKKSTIRADKFKTEDSNQIIKLDGNVDSNFDLKH
jgi:lipopolysaccharide export system protein LptC